MKHRPRQTDEDEETETDRFTGKHTVIPQIQPQGAVEKTLCNPQCPSPALPAA